MRFQLSLQQNKDVELFGVEYYLVLEILLQDLLLCDIITLSLGKVSKISAQFKRMFSFKTFLMYVLLII